MRYLIAIVAGLLPMAAAAQNVSNYTEQGGAKTVIGGELEIQSGATLDIQSGATWTLVDGTIPRADLAEESLATFHIPGHSFYADGGGLLTASEDAGTFYLGESSGLPAVIGETADNETEASVLNAIVALPENYVADADVQINVVYLVTGGGVDGGAASTVDVVVKEAGRAGSVGSDLVTTDAQTADVSGSVDTDTFVVTDTNLEPGDLLWIELTTSIVDDSGGTDLTFTLVSLDLLVDVKG